MKAYRKREDLAVVWIPSLGKIVDSKPIEGDLDSFVPEFLEEINASEAKKSPKKPGPKKKAKLGPEPAPAELDPTPVEPQLAEKDSEPAKEATEKVETAEAPIPSDEPEELADSSGPIVEPATESASEPEVMGIESEAELKDPATKPRRKKKRRKKVVED